MPSSRPTQGHRPLVDDERPVGSSIPGQQSKQDPSLPHRSLARSGEDEGVQGGTTPPPYSAPGSQNSSKTAWVPPTSSSAGGEEELGFGWESDVPK